MKPEIYQKAWMLKQVQHDICNIFYFLVSLGSLKLSAIDAILARKAVPDSACPHVPCNWEKIVQFIIHNS
jgi:hypothetical protein